MIKRVFMGMWKPDRTVISLHCGMVYASSRAMGAKNLSIASRKGREIFFGGDRTAGAGSVARNRSENLHKYLHKYFDMSQAHETLMSRLRASYGKSQKVRKPGVEVRWCDLGSSRSVTSPYSRAKIRAVVWRW